MDKNMEREWTRTSKEDGEEDGGDDGQRHGKTMARRMQREIEWKALNRLTSCKRYDPSIVARFETPVIPQLRRGSLTSRLPQALGKW